MHKIKIILILILALVLRLVNLNQSFWLDEASQAQLSSMTVSQIWFDRSADFHPPLFYLLAHVWLYFGRWEIWLRTLPVLFGVANVGIIYLFFKDKTALIAAFLLAINPFHIYYSQEFRAYSLLALLGTLSMYFLLKKKYLGVAVVNALMLYTHYSATLLIVTQFFIDPQALRYSIISLVLYLPWIPQFLYQLQSGVNIDAYLPGWRQILSVSPLKSLPLFLFKFAAGRINLSSKYLYLLYIIFVLASSSAAVWVARAHRSFLYKWFLIPLGLSLLVSFAIPQTQPFRLIFILPALILFFAQAVQRYPKTFFTIFVYISVFGNLLYFTRPRLQREQWRQAIEFINARPAPAIVAFSGKFSPLLWYPTKFQVIPAVSSYPAKTQQVGKTLAESTLPAKVYYFEYLSDLSDPQRTVRLTLENLGFHLTATYNFSGVGFIFEYQKS